jgi:pheromone shutdown protein TraB
MGVLSALPILNLGNVCCCLWVICGGMVAAYVLQQEQAEPITAGDGALVGLFAGLFGTLVTSVLSIPINLMVAPIQRQFLERLNQNGQMPQGFEDFASSAAVGLIGTVIFAMVFLVAGVIFSTLGGLLGAAIFKKPARPATGGTSL